MSNRAKPILAILLDDPPKAMPDYLTGSDTGVGDGWRLGAIEGGVSDGLEGGNGSVLTGPSGAVTGSVRGTIVCRRIGSPILAMLRAPRWQVESVKELWKFLHFVDHLKPCRAARSFRSSQDDCSG